MTVTGVPTRIMRARELGPGDLVDGTLLLVELRRHDSGAAILPGDWRAAQRRLWDVRHAWEGGSSSPSAIVRDGEVYVVTGRHGNWTVPADMLVTVRGTLRKD